MERIKDRVFYQARIRKPESTICTTNRRKSSSPLFCGKKPISQRNPLLLPPVSLRSGEGDCLSYA